MKVFLAQQTESTLSVIPCGSDIVIILTTSSHGKSNPLVKERTSFTINSEQNSTQQDPCRTEEGVAYVRKKIATNWYVS